MTDTPHTTREQFIGEVRKALGRSGPLSQVPQAPAVDDALIRLASKGDDLVTMFAERAEAVGMKVHRMSQADLLGRFADVLVERGIKRITLADSTPYLDELTAACQRGGIELAEWRGDRTMANHYDADAGVSGVHAALAETGSMICCSDARTGRGHSLTPEHHVAIVRRGDILPDMLDYMARQSGKSPMQLPSAQAIITGPSKTADIEGILITGVHGPATVDILLVGDEGIRD